MTYTQEFNIALAAIKKASAFLHGLDSRKVNSQNGRDIKLEADCESEKIIIDSLSSTQIPILSEENGASGDFCGGLRWIVDPLDGSYNYFRGLANLCCVSIALWRDNEPLFGIVSRFNQDEIIYGVAGQGAVLNGKKVSPSAIHDLDHACCATGLPVKGDFSPAALGEYISLMRKMKKVRMLGAAAIMSSSVACGRIDIYAERDCMLWDVAAGIAIVQAAGGCADFRIKRDYKCDVACFANIDLCRRFRQQIADFKKDVP